MKSGYEDLLRAEREDWEKDLVKIRIDLNQERKKVRDLEDVVDHLRAHNEELRQRGDDWEHSFRNLVEHTENGALYQTLRNEMNYWRNTFGRLAAIANSAIEEVPDRLRAANIAMMPQSTLKDVKDFLEFCSDMIWDFKRRIRGN